MKLLADMICHAAPTARFKQIRDIADRLRKPALNHVPGDFATPALERIVFGLEEGDALWGLAMATAAPGADLPLKMPLPEFWIEARVKSSFSGFHVSETKEKNGYNVDVYLAPLAKAPYPFVTLHVSSDGILSDKCTRIGRSLMGESDEVKYATQYTRLFHALITCTGRHMRQATTRRTHRYEGFPNISVATRRAAQRGMPVYSFNEVKFAFPRNSIQRGAVRQSASDSVRGHWVISHWRLIGDGTSEAQFVWIAGHKRGNEELGFVTKQRNFNTTKHAARGLPPGVKGAFGVAV